MLPKTANGMVRPCSGPASKRSLQGRQRQGARHVTQAEFRNRRDRHALTRPNRSAIPLRQDHSCSFDRLVCGRVHKKSIFCTKSPPLVELYVQSHNWGRLGEWEFLVCHEPQRLGESLAKTSGKSRADSDGSASWAAEFTWLENGTPQATRPSLDQ
jgi:hypothetical protein